jgi:hypothetical protein
MKQLAWECGAKAQLRTFGLQDAFIHVHGSHADLLSAHGLSAERIAASVLDSMAVAK